MRFEAEALWRPVELAQRRGAVIIGCILVVVLALVSLANIWLRNESVVFGLGGFFMVSDASGYYDCSQWLLQSGTSVNEWCQRRLPYPALLASLSLLTGHV